MHLKLKLIPVLFLAFSITLLSGCLKDNANDISKGEVNIRIENNSIFDFQLIEVNTSGGENFYGNLTSGQVSDYKSYEKAFRYASIEMTIKGEKATLQPFDYVGETPLTSGNHTYSMDVSRSAGQYILKLRLKQI